jgi:hypothetical protein
VIHGCYGKPGTTYKGKLPVGVECLEVSGTVRVNVETDVHAIRVGALH